MIPDYRNSVGLNMKCIYSNMMIMYGIKQYIWLLKAFEYFLSIYVNKSL